PLCHPPSTFTREARPQNHFTGGSEMKQPRKRRAAAVAPGTLLAGRLRSPPSDAAQTARASLPYSRENQDIDNATPVQHVKRLSGENRTFDHAFATYKPEHG